MEGERGKQKNVLKTIFYILPYKCISCNFSKIIAPETSNFEAIQLIKKLKKSHNSPDSCWILHQIEFDHYFINIYLCVIHESNKIILWKDYELRPFF